MSSRYGVLLVGAVVSFCPSAYAIIHGGNPHFPPSASIRVLPPEGTIDSSSVHISHIRVHACGGGYTDYPVDEVVDLGDWYSVPIDGGDLCALGIAWGGELLAEGTDDGGADFALRFVGLASTAPITGAVESQIMAPVVVEEGSVPPELILETTIID